MTRSAYDLRRSAGSVTLSLAGEFDLADCEELKRHLANAEAAPGVELTLDVRAVLFIDLTCLRAIDGCRRRLAAQSRRLVLTGASSRFRRISELAGYPELGRP